MGAQVDPQRTVSRADFRARLATCLDVLGRMLDEDAAARAAGAPERSPFEAGEPTTGMEVEAVLVRAAGPRAWCPAPTGGPVLDAVDDPDVVPEIGRHTLEPNVPPATAAGHALAALEADLRARLGATDDAARAHGSRLLLLGVLPTLTEADLRGDWRTPTDRYAALDAAVLAARGEDVALDITGPDGEHLATALPSIAAEAACTSTQLHLKTAPADFAATWNAAQLLAGPQVALAANSPFALGARLWPETRVPLFTQSVDVRTPEDAAQGQRPRVFAGSGWATSVLDLLAEDAAWFTPLLPQLDEEDPLAVRAAGGVPHLAELGLQSGTVWRWNRPVYDVTTGPDGRARAHLRVENRVLASAPTVLDAVADAAVFHGAVRVLVQDGPDPAALLPGGAPAAAITACARDGLDALVAWPGLCARPAVPVREVLLEHVLPMAADGLARWGVPAALAARYLDVAAARAATGRTGAAWQVAALAAREGAGEDRATALRAVVAGYAERQATGEPVHTWSPL